jgi:antitoxin YefM
MASCTTSQRTSSSCVPLSEAKDKLSSLVDEADKTHEIIQITRHGHPSAVLMSADDLESLQETIYWLSQPEIREDLTQARRDIAEGTTVSREDLRREFGLPPR